MIPDEAVEAASKAVYESRYADLRVWEDLDAADKDEMREEQAIALEAAAPHLARAAQADAWDEGELAGYTNAGAEQWGYDQRFNPYRKPTDAV